MGEIAALQKYRHFENELPLSIIDRLTELSPEAQLEFYEEYTRRSRSEVAGFLLHFFFGLRYGYLDKWLLQVLAWLSWGFMGIGMVWWVVDFFRIPGLVKNHNKKVARNILKNVLMRHRSHRKVSGNGRFQINGGEAALRAPDFPRAMPKPDPNNAVLGLEHLQKGYYLITNESPTGWQVIYEGQYDWNDQQSEKEFKLTDERDQTAFAFVRHEKGQWKAFLTRAVSAYSLHEHLEEEIYGRKRPFNILNWEGNTYYRENEKEGYFFDLSRRDTSAQWGKIWEYYDGDQQRYLRLMQLGPKELKAFVGERLSPYEITVLPEA
ncbi:MAG: hypothetical protein ACFCUI_10595 [Bernardetiaceae bacterium]